MSKPSDADIAHYFDGQVDCCGPRRDPNKRPQVALAKLLLTRVVAAGLNGKSVLEVGCGRGELSAEMLRAGALRVTGTDLSAPSIELANRMKKEDGLGDKLQFVVENATGSLPQHDAVVHHRVICCYPNADEFMERTIAASRSLYAYSMPKSAGLGGLCMRVALLAENIDHRFRHGAFRVYDHDEKRVDAMLRNAGFRLHSRANQFGWFAAAYVR